MADSPPMNGNLPSCRLGGPCALYSRDSYLGSYGIVQCHRCSQVYEPTGWTPRVCAHCELPWGESLHDPCLGGLPPDPVHGRLTQACCGHGNPDRAYRIYADATRINGVIPT